MCLNPHESFNTLVYSGNAQDWPAETFEESFPAVGFGAIEIRASPAERARGRRDKTNTKGRGGHVGSQF